MDEFSTEPRHPIQVAAGRAGLTPTLVRAWERRYGAVTPGRSAGGRRLFSDLDVERLRLMKVAIDAGRRAGDVAGLGLPELRDIVREDTAAWTAVPGPRDDEATAAHEYRRRAVDAVVRCDADRLRRIVDRAATVLSPVAFLERLGRPLMHQVGALWASGDLTPGHEHMASGVLRDTLGRLADALQAGPDAPHLVVATPSGERHELGALAVTAATGLWGWRSTYLSSDLPAEGIAVVVASTPTAAVAVSTTMTNPSVLDEIGRLKELIGETSLFVGGQAVTSIQEDVRAKGGIPVTGLEGLEPELADLG